MELQEMIANYLQAEMVTIGTCRGDVKTGQMWTCDAERLSKRILVLVKHYCKSQQTPTNT